ncbi:MAG: hypothetical protein CO149_02240 [Nitrospirae bacterium CG_4_9_14_3_um_filter_51_5]|nr:MAG: hypothetical protein CO149_02240 [Nitrospirae bacterium CG_4_9_14_3_um_filter_51_5]
MPDIAQHLEEKPSSYMRHPVQGHMDTDVHARNLMQKLGVDSWGVSRPRFPHRPQDNWYIRPFWGRHDGYNNDERIAGRS